MGYKTINGIVHAALIIAILRVIIVVHAKSIQKAVFKIT